MLLLPLRITLKCEEKPAQLDAYASRFPRLLIEMTSPRRRVSLQRRASALLRVPARCILPNAFVSRFLVLLSTDIGLYIEDRRAVIHINSFYMDDRTVNL